MQEIQRILINPVWDIINEPNYAGVYQRFGAVDAWEMGDITGAVFNGDPMQRCLDDGVGFSMYGANAMTIYKQVSNLITMGLP